MSMQDPIADMLTQIRNAQAVAKEEVNLIYSRIKTAIAEVLKREGYVLDYKVIEMQGSLKKTLQIFLKYQQNGMPLIERIERASKPGLRRYSSVDDLPKVMNGMGIVVVSTSKGIMADHEARKLRLGGEILCYVN